MKWAEDDFADIFQDPFPEEETEEEIWEDEDNVREEKIRKRRPLKREKRPPLKGGRWTRKRRAS